MLCDINKKIELPKCIECKKPIPEGKGIHQKKDIIKGKYGSEIIC